MHVAPVLLELEPGPLERVVLAARLQDDLGQREMTDLERRLVLPMVQQKRLLQHGVAVEVEVVMRSFRVAVVVDRGKLAGELDRK